MNRENVFVDKINMYGLSRDAEGRLYLELLIGGVAMDHAYMMLNQDEITQYQRDEKMYLDWLADEVVANREQYDNRLHYD